jgi:hypothetical protein
LPHIFGYVRARDPCEGFYHFVWVPRFVKKYFQLTKLPAEVYILVLVQEYKKIMVYMLAKAKTDHANI